MSALPIVFNHRVAPSSYLIAAALQAKLTNPASPVILLHDFAAVPPELPGHGIECIHVRELYGECAKVDEHWFNISRNPAEYELGTMQRWMLLRNLMRSRQLTSCFALDSDVLLYSDIDRAQNPFRGFDFTISSETWSCAFFNNVRVLDVFHDLVIELYERRTGLWWRVLEALNVLRTDALIGNLADTVLIKLFLREIAAEHGFRWTDTAAIVDGSVFCPDLRSDAVPCEMESHAAEPSDPRPLRRIFWQDGMPYGRALAGGGLVRMNGLHFRGSLKHSLLMSCFTSFVEHLRSSARSETNHGAGTELLH